MAEIPAAALQPRGACVVSPRIFQCVGCYAEADPITRSWRPTAAQTIRIMIHSCA